MSSDCSFVKVLREQVSLALAKDGRPEEVEDGYSVGYVGNSTKNYFENFVNPERDSL